MKTPCQQSIIHNDYDVIIGLAVKSNRKDFLIFADRRLVPNRNQNESGSLRDLFRGSQYKYIEIPIEKGTFDYSTVLVCG